MSLRCSVLKSGFCELTQGFVNGHRGLDLVDKGYTIGDIVSYDNGTVVMVTNGYRNGQGEGVNWAYGNFVKVLHDNGTVCLYAHMEYTSVAYGQRVSKGQFLGRMGNSGNSGGGHLHWEFWSSNNYNANIDPMPYLEPKPQYNYEGSFDAIDLIKDNRFNIRGWYWNDLNDEAMPVHIYIRKDNENKFVVGINASEYREDLKNAGKGSGNHAFNYEYDFDNLGPGTYEVTVYQIRYDGNNPPMGTKTITIEPKIIVEEPIIEKPKQDEVVDVPKNDTDTPTVEDKEQDSTNTTEEDKASRNGFKTIIFGILEKVLEYLRKRFIK